ncbi:unnamed protein product [Somion occarium]|uniref:RNase H type-1 domain-containing protein n=1 Tax=Somion occarium TaxID=3059160 RepID=A0ABP1DU02_9APHY
MSYLPVFFALPRQSRCVYRSSYLNAAVGPLPAHYSSRRPKWLYSFQGSTRSHTSSSLRSQTVISTLPPASPNTKFRLLSTDLDAPITRTETALLRRILPSWEVPGVLISYPERATIVRALKRCSRIIPEGLTRLGALCRFALSGAKDQAIVPPLDAVCEVRWWSQRLSRPVFSQLTLHSARPSALKDVEVYVDASRIGIGVSIDRLWLAWKLSPPLSGNGDIGWAELLSCELALRALIAQGHESCQVPIHVDSTEAARYLKIGFSHHERHNLIVRRIQGLQQSSGVHLQVLKVPGRLNLAHGLSMGILHRESRRFSLPVVLPFELSNLLEPL